MRTQIRTAVICAAGLLTSVFGSMAIADEVTVRNDSLQDGGTVAICPCFVAGEEAAVWLTSPCDGEIVAIQIFWRSLGGGAQVSLEDSIIVYEAGNFPNPGPIKDSFDAPALSDGGLNEFRYEDENQTIPISIPVEQGEEFVVSLRFFNTNNTNPSLPSVVADTSGCQQGKNTVKVNGQFWASACDLGVSGDWVIRAVIDCGGDPVGAACLPDGTCAEGLTEDQTLALGGSWNGAGSECGDVQCLGACYIPATDQCLQFDLATCDLVGGDWAGPGTSDCPDPCPGDFNGDGNLNFFDVSAFLGAFNGGDLAADINDDGSLDFFDVSAFLSSFSGGCP
ncbi:MAG: GC-type dockerin domain-anchored protein [Phycisphaerales bacterium]